MEYTQLPNVPDESGVSKPIEKPASFQGGPNLSSQYLSPQPVVAQAEPGLIAGPRWKTWLGIIGLFFAISGLMAGLGLAVFKLGHKTVPAATDATSYAVTSIPLDGLAQGQTEISAEKILSINGQLKANGIFVLTPSAQPTSPQAGQLYYDQSTNQPYYYNGTSFVAFNSPPDVNSFQGRTGAITIQAGSGIAINGTTISSTVSSASGGVTSLTGTSGQVLVSSSSGAVRLSLPQNIDVTAAPTFAGLTIGGTSIFAGDVSAASFKQNGNVVCDISNNCGFSGGTGNFSNGGNTFGATADLGTNDGFALNLRTGGVTRFSLDTSGNSNLTGTATAAAFSGNGSALSSLNASNLTTGTVNDGRLSSNVPLKNGANTFSALNNFTGGLQANGNTVCDSSGNCSPGGAAGGDLTGTFPNPTIAKLQGTGLNINAPLGGHVLVYNATNGRWENHAVSSDITLNETGVATIATNAVTTGKIADGNVTNNKLQNSSLTVTAGTNLSGGGNVALGGSISLAIVSSPVFSGTLSVQGASATIGTSSQSGSLVLNDGSSNTGTFRTAALGQDTVYTLPDPGSGTVSICLTSGNCSGAGGGVTSPGGTAGAIAKFTGSQAVADSTLSESGSAVTASGTVVIQGANALTLGVASTNAGAVLFKNATNANTLTLKSGVSGSNFSLTLPTSPGNNGDCLQTNGVGGVLSFTACTGGAGGGVTSVNSQTGVVSLANATGSGGTVTIDNAAADGATKGIASFNSTNFSAAGGIVNTIQGIATTSTPTFAAGTFTNASSLTLGLASTNTGSVIFKGSGSANAVTLVGPATPSTNTLTLPNETGTICSTGSICTGYQASIANYVASLGTLTGLSATGNSGAGSTPTLSVTYGSSANTSVQGNTVLICPSASGNASLSGTGNSITLGAGGTCNAISLSNTPSFTSASLTGTSSLTLGTASTNTGSVLFKGASSANTLTLIGPTTPSTNTLTLPNETGTLCVQNSANCGFLTGAAAGGAYFAQGGNSFSALAVLGTNDANSLAFRTSSTNRLILDTSGNLAFQQASTVSTIAAATAGSLTIQPGSSSGVSGAALTLQAGNSTSVGATDTGGTTTIKGGTIGSMTGATLTVGGGGLNSGFGVGGNLTLDGGTGTFLNGQVIIGTTNASAVTIGNATNNTQFTVNSGTGAINIGTASQARTIQIGTGLAAQSVTLGSTNTTSTTTIQGGTGAAAISIQSGASGTINIATANAANTVQIGNTANAIAQTINIGNNATASSSSTIVLGSTIAGTTTLQSAGGTNVGVANSQVGKFNFFGSGSANSIALVGPTSPGIGLTLTLPNETGTLCSTGSVCAGYMAAPVGGGNFLKQVPATTADNTITPTANNVVGLTVNGTSGSATTAVNIIQGGNATALNISGGGTGNLAFLDTTNASANGISLDVQSSSASQYALQVTSNNGSTNVLYARADGNVGIGTAAPSEKLEVVGDIISKGTSWTSRTSSGDNSWNSVTYGNGIFVAVSTTAGAGNHVMTSPDGINWTARTATDNFWGAVTYGNGLFVAVGYTGTGNRVMTSPDGINWTARTSAADNTWISVAYGNGLFVAVSTDGTSNHVMTSPDGITWTLRTSAADNIWVDITYGNGLFVAVSNTGTGNRVMTSPDGITWTSRTSTADNTWSGITYAQGLFVAVGSSGTGNRVMTSPDGITWTSRTSAADNGWASVTYGSGLFVAVAGAGGSNRVMTSPDGITWTLRTANSDSNFWRDVIYGNGMFVATSGSGTGNRVMTSGKADYIPSSNNNIYQGGMSVLSGDALFRPADNSTSSFQVQNSAATPVLSVDTTNSQLVVRGANSDAVIGTEIIASQDFTNATFWNNSTGWTETTTTATHTTGNTTDLTATAANITVVAGTTYQVTFTVASNSTSTNTVTPKIGGVSGTAIGNNVTATVMITATATTALTFTPTTNFNGIISAVSVKAVTVTAAPVQVKNSGNSVTLEVRASGATSNTFIGLNAGFVNTSSGVQNTAIGSGALQSNTTGTQNTALGNNALQNNVSGSQNIAIGYQALQNNMTASQNIAIGNQTLQKNTSGTQNVAVGYLSLQSNTTGAGNTSTGYQAMQLFIAGSANSAYGNQSMQGSTTGDSNSAFGASTLRNNTGNFNSAFGVGALQANTSGNNNTAIGVNTLNSLNTSTFNNTAVGFQALFANNASSNTAVGANSMANNTSGTKNVSLGESALLGNTTGNNNTAVGYQAGYQDPTVTAFNTTNNLSNSTTLGYGSQVQASNSLILGGQGANAVNVGIGTTSPTNTFSVSPDQYDTGTAGTGGVSSTTVTGSGTTWTAAMVGSEFIFADGTKRTITAFGSTTSLTLASAVTEAAGRSYRIHLPALQVTSGGNVGIGTVTPNEKLEVNGNIQINGGQYLYLGGQTVRTDTAIGRDGTTNAIVFRTSNTDRLQIADSGSIRLLDNIIQSGSGVNALGDSESMVPNAGFEVNDDATTTVADSWVFLPGAGSPTASVTTSNAGQGDRSQEITANTTWNGEIRSICIPITASQTYDLHAWVKGSSASTSTLDMSLITYPDKQNCVDSTGATTVAVVTGGSVTTSYASYGTSTVTVGSSARWARVSIGNTTPSVNNTIGIDSVRLTPASVATGIDLAENYPALSRDNLIPGELVSMGSPAPEGGTYAVRSSDSYDSKLFGIVSTQPGIVLDDGKGYEHVTVALAGRVPVKVNNENGPIKIGDSITSSSTGGVGMKSTHYGRIIGTAMQTFDGSGEGTITVFVNPGWYTPPPPELQGNNNTNIQAVNAAISGTATINNATITNLNVSGATDLQTLTVTGNAMFEGTLTVKDVVITASLTVNGHIISGNASGSTTVTLGAGAVCTSGGSATISGNDTSGTVTINAGTGAGCAAGIIATINFANAYGAAPRIVLTPVNAGATGLQYFSDTTAVTTTTFTIDSNNAPAASTTYKYTYQVIQ